MRKYKKHKNVIQQNLYSLMHLCCLYQSSVVTYTPLRFKVQWFERFSASSGVKKRVIFPLYRALILQGPRVNPRKVPASMSFLFTALNELRAFMVSADKSWAKKIFWPSWVSERCLGVLKTNSRSWKSQESDDYSSAPIRSWSCQSAVRSLQGEWFLSIEPQPHR